MEENKTVFKKAIILYKFLVLKSLKNKLKNTTPFSFLFSIAIILFSVYFFIYYMKKSIASAFVYNIGGDILPSPRFGWILFAYLFFSLAFFDRFSLPKSILFLYELTPFKSKRENSLLLFSLLNNLSNFLFPFLISFAFYLAIENLKIAFNLFLFMFMLNIFLQLLKYSMFISLNQNNWQYKTFRIFFIFISLMSIVLFLKNIKLPGVLYKLFYPYIFAIACLFSPQNYVFKPDAWLFSLVFILVVLFIHLIHYFENSEIKFSNQEINYKKKNISFLWPIKLINNPLVNKEIKKVLNETSNFVNFFVILFIIGISDLFFYKYFISSNTLPVYKKTLIVLLLPNIILSVYYYTLAPFAEKQNLWIYCLTQKTTKKLFTFYFQFYLGFSFLVSLLLLINFKILSMFFHIKNIFTLKFFLWFFIHTINAPVWLIIISFFIGLKLGHLLNNRALKPLIYIGLTWLFVYVIFPYAYLLNRVKGLLFLPFIVLFNALLIFLAIKFLDKLKICVEE